MWLYKRKRKEEKIGRTIRLQFPIQKLHTIPSMGEVWGSVRPKPKPLFCGLDQMPKLKPKMAEPKRIYNPITAMGFSAMFTFQLYYEVNIAGTLLP